MISDSLLPKKMIEFKSQDIDCEPKSTNITCEGTQFEPDNSMLETTFSGNSYNKSAQDVNNSAVSGMSPSSSSASDPPPHIDFISRFDGQPEDDK